MLLLIAGCKNEETTKFEAEKETIELERAEKEARASIEEANKMIPLLIGEGKFEDAGKYFAEDVVQIISSQHGIFTVLFVDIRAFCFPFPDNLLRPLTLI